MPLDDKPQTWGSATKALRKTAAAGDIGDEALFGDDPLSPKLQKKKPTDSSLDYLGHFANDDVAEEGHNSGAPGEKGGKPSIRRFHTGAVAKTGFRTIPGNASTGFLDKKTRALLNTAESGLGRIVPTGPVTMPVGGPLRHEAREAKLAAGRGVGIASMTKVKAPKPPTAPKTLRKTLR